MGFSFCLLYSLSFCLFLLLSRPISAFYKYDSSFAFLNVRGKNWAPEGLDFCVNFQQWHSRQLPSSADTNNFLQIGWWNHTLNTNICLQNGYNFARNELIPVDYRTLPSELLACQFRQGEAPINASLNRLKPKGVQNVLFLVEKGKRNKYGTRNFLFSQFYNAEINDSDISTSVFFVYNDSFRQEIEPLLVNSSAAELRFYRPQSAWPIDPAVGLLWLFAVGSILIGSLWAAVESKASLEKRVPLDIAVSEGMASSRMALSEENQPSHANEPNKGPLKRSQSAEFAQMTLWQHLSVVSVALVFIVFVLTFAYFFRKIALFGFCVVLWFLGICSVHSCLYTFLKAFLGDKKMPPLRKCFGCSQNEDGRSSPTTENEQNDTNETTSAANPENIGIGTQPTATAASVSAASTSAVPPTTAPIANGTPFPKSLSLFDRPIHLLSSIVLLFALFLCTVWFIFREHHNAFYLLDFINIMVCVFAVKGSRIRSLRLLTLLMLAMFIYDLFMVFGTTLLTADGCSVMMEVVTGVDCQQKRAESASVAGKKYQPIAPIDLKEVPEKIPLLFYVPMLADPMGRCFDVEVEREYKRVMLGLGDVIIPGYLITFCFYVDVVKRSSFYTYGSISLFGYSLGMFATFVALLLTETGQPALLYLVPFTLCPIFAWAFFVDGNGILGKMWRGEL